MTLAIVNRQHGPHGWFYTARYARCSSPLTSLVEARHWAAERGATFVVEQWDGGAVWTVGPRGGLRRLWS